MRGMVGVSENLLDMSPSGMFKALGRVGVLLALVLVAVPVASVDARADQPRLSAPSSIGPLVVFARQEADEDSQRSSVGTAGPRLSLKKPAPNLDTDLFVVAPDGTGITRLTGAANVEDGDPEWSPDRQRIVFTRRVGKQDSDIYVMDADARNLVRLTRGAAWDYQPTWSPDGNRIAYMSGMKLFVIDASGRGEPRRLTMACGDASPAWSPDGKYIAFSRSVLDGCSSGNDEIFVMDLETQTAERITDNPANDWSPAWSPDGKLIVFERYECLIASPVPDSPGCIVGEDMELYVMRPDGSDVRRLTDNDVDEYSPAWSPDGRWVVFSRVDPSRNYDLDLYRITVDGSRAERLTESARSDDRNPDL